MKTVKWLAAFVAFAALGSTAAWADHHPRVHFGLVIGSPYWGPPWGYPPPYYYPPYYPPVVVERPAPVYIEQAPPAVAAPAPAPAAQNYWYYCAAARGYYPYVKECPSGWQKVAPTPAQP
ncbi:MAG: hypothetical protein ACM3Y9_13190 [Ignavibacteria bacterium]